MAQQEVVEITGSIEKLETFSSKGGGYTLKIQTSEDDATMAHFLGKTQRVADITFSFRETHTDTDPDTSPGLDFDEDGE